MEWAVCGKSIHVTKPMVMGIVNASPESFSDSAAMQKATVEQRVYLALALVESGADIIDIGGQSSRRDVEEISVGQEIDRILPVLEGIRQNSKVLLSIDTYRAEVAKEVVRCGAHIVNDMSGLGDPEMVSVVAKTGAGLILVHTEVPVKSSVQHTPYGTEEDLLTRVTSFFEERISAATAGGVSALQVIVDPGPDVGKTPAQTVALLQNLQVLSSLKRPVLLALSRKSFIGAASGSAPAARMAGTAAAITWCVNKVEGCILRVHDVSGTRQILDVLSVLDGERELPWDEFLAERFRHNP